MKNQLIVLVSALALIACNDKKEDGSITSTGVMEVEESTELSEKLKSGMDSSVTLTDGRRIPVVISPVDSINLPQELLHVINNTSEIHPDSIVVKRRFVENNITYYELEFRMQDGSNQTFTFDEDGKRKSID
ncbi:hypothetical protein [Algoriphagus aquimarinus]|uniref:hypothetical protein n=1 Tax=Algoriphagus aquimarinus TaxID=237018 RepID=UPI0030DB20D4|tara:strand:+ start:167873 stop:168268 length:396 start_codon:yes stop_codon:yes gene_type:complete